MDKLVYYNTITEKVCNFLAYGRRALRGLIQEDNIQGRHILQGETERAGTLT